MTARESIAAGKAALQAGRWTDARAAFETALTEAEAPGALVGMGEALWWLGETQRSVEFYERGYAEFRRARDVSAAAWAAIWLCVSYKTDFGNQSASSGWAARAERLLQDAGPNSLSGWLSLAKSYDATDLITARELAERALDIAQNYGDPDLELCALGDLGELLVEAGQVQEGFALIDEAMAGAYGGDRNRLDTVVFTSCNMLSVCELVADIERATQWCQVTSAFARTYGCPFLHARCRIAYGDILVLTGQWVDAEREITAAVEMTRAAWPVMHAQALARLADLRLRQGRLEEAEGLLAGLDDERATALPVATARLMRGEPSAAVSLLQRRLNLGDQDSPEMAQALELLAEAHLAQGAVSAAAIAAKRLNDIARQHGRDQILARSALVSARVTMAGGQPEAAARQMEDALERFSRLRMSPDVARTRLELARSLAGSHPEAAVAEARSALSTFEQMGAAASADAAAAFLRSLGVAGRTGPKDIGILTQREQEVLRLVGFGLSNPEIALRLVISRKTAAHHVSSVLDKLGLRNRAEAAAYITRTLGEPASRDG